MTESDLCFLSATKLSALIANREISPTDIVKALLARIETLNDRVKAYIHICGKQALAAAQEMETEIGSGNPRSPLQGIPVAYKDIYGSSGKCRGRLMDKKQAELKVDIVSEPISLSFEHFDFIVESFQRTG